MYTIRPWLFIGKFAETIDKRLLESYQIEVMLQFAERIEQPGIATLYLPVDDGVSLNIDHLKQGLEFIQTHNEQDKKIMVSCGAGISRSTSYAIAALKEIENLSLLESLRAVKKHHPKALPHFALWKSLCSYFDEDISYDEVMQGFSYS